MIRDGICDELTNTEVCEYDGGDCCLDKNRKDTSMCETCTCLQSVSIDDLESKFKSTEVMMFQHSGNFDNLVLHWEKVVVDVRSDLICFTLCLDAEAQEFVNGWKFDSDSNTCSCAWLKSTECANELNLTNVTVEDYLSLNALRYCKT